MAFSDIATLQFQAHHIPTGQAYRNTFHFRRNPTAGSVDATWLQAWLADANTTLLVNSYKAILTANDRLDGVLGRATQDPTDSDADRDEGFRVEGVAGTRSAGGIQAPIEACILMKLSGDLAGRSYRGRVFLPPGQDRGSLDGENWDSVSAYVGTCSNFRLELLKTTYTSGAGHYGGAWNDVDMVVFSRTRRIAGDTYYARVPAIALPRRVRWLRSRAPEVA